jgi:GDPmannose 4,6-dehydratase
VHFHNYNIGNELAFAEILRQEQPNEIYSLAGESFTALSFEEPKHFMNINIDSVVEQLESIRVIAPEAKVFFASSSEVFGESGLRHKLNEDSQKLPMTPYGVSKLTQNHLVRIYRERYGLSLYTGILFPHESPFRSPEFVTRKICRGLVSNFKGLVKPIQMGDLSMERDWGSARDFVKWFNLLLLKGVPGDYVFGTGKNTSVEEFLILTANELGIDLIRTENDNSTQIEYLESRSGKVWVNSDPSKFSANRFSYGPADASRLFGEIGEEKISQVTDIVKDLIHFELHNAG